jgi:hypothetical protein
MLFLDILTQRIIFVLIVQIWPIFYCSYFAYKLLKRAKNRTTYTLSSFFILFSLTDILANLSIVFLFTPIAYFFYVLAVYFLFFDHCLFIIFSWVLVKLDERPPNWKVSLNIFLYGIISTYVFWIGFFFNGIIYDSTTSWVPTFSWLFLIFSWTFLVAFLIIPQIYFSLKLLKIFEGVTLKRRINMFIIGTFVELSVVFIFFLYRVLIDNPFFGIFYISLVTIVSPIAAFVIYKSFLKELE